MTNSEKMKMGKEEMRSKMILLGSEMILLGSEILNCMMRLGKLRFVRAELTKYRHMLDKRMWTKEVGSKTILLGSKMILMESVTLGRGGTHPYLTVWGLNEN